MALLPCGTPASSTNFVPVTKTDPDPGLISHLVAVPQSPSLRSEPSTTEAPGWSVRQVLVRPDRIKAPTKRFWIVVGAASVDGRRETRIVMVSVVGKSIVEVLV